MSSDFFFPFKRVKTSVDKCYLNIMLMSFLTLSEFGAKYISSVVFCSSTVTGLFLPLVYLAGKDQSHLVIGESVLRIRSSL